MICGDPAGARRCPRGEGAGQPRLHSTRPRSHDSPDAAVELDTGEGTVGALVQAVCGQGPRGARLPEDEVGRGAGRDLALPLDPERAPPGWSPASEARRSQPSPDGGPPRGSPGAAPRRRRCRTGATGSRRVRKAAGKAPVHGRSRSCRSCRRARPPRATRRRPGNGVAEPRANAPDAHVRSTTRPATDGACRPLPRPSDLSHARRAPVSTDPAVVRCTRYTGARRRPA